MLAWLGTITLPEGSRLQHQPHPWWGHRLSPGRSHRGEGSYNGMYAESSSMPLESMPGMVESCQERTPWKPRVLQRDPGHNSSPPSKTYRGDTSPSYRRQQRLRRLKSM